MAFLDDMIKKNQEEKKTLAKIAGNVSGIGNENSIVAMQRNNFSYKRELKSLFSKAMGGNDIESSGKDREAAAQGNIR